MEAKNSLKEIFEKIETNAVAEYIILASIVGLSVSSYALHNSQESLDNLDSVSEDLEQFREKMDTSGFNRTLQVLESAEGSELSEQFSYTVEGFRDLRSSLREIERVRREIRERLKIFRWFNLFSFAGLLLGFGLLISKESREE